MGAKRQKRQPGHSTGFMWENLGLEVFCGCPFVKSPTETHVRCLFEEATRFISTKLKRFKHAAHRLEKKNIRAGGWVNTHNDFCKGGSGGGQCRHGFSMEASDWLVAAFFRIIRASWSFTVLAGR